MLRSLSNWTLQVTAINLLYRAIICVIFDKPILSDGYHTFIIDNIGLSNKCDNGLPKASSPPIIRTFCIPQSKGMPVLAR